MTWSRVTKGGWHTVADKRQARLAISARPPAIAAQPTGAGVMEALLDRGFCFIEFFFIEHGPKLLLLISAAFLRPRAHPHGEPTHAPVDDAPPWMRSRCWGARGMGG